MKKTYLFICILSCLMVSALPQDKFPEAEISNGLIRAHFYLPDANIGYYRGTRFDWSGIITSLEYKGHNYYGQWFAKYNPTTHDAVMGPVEEFAPVGYTEAKSGGTFVKVGIGSLSKPVESAYSSYKLYQITNPGKWEVNKRSDQIQFVHKLDDAEYPYEYSKTIKLTKGKPELVISHSLKNKGKRTIETNAYDHNFLVIDKEPTGPGYVVKFPVEVTGTGKGFGDLARIRGKELTFIKELARSESIYCAGLQGLSDNPKDYDIRVENIKTGAGVRITCDRPILKLVFWCSSTTVCPEPYIQIKAEPGKEFTWKITYQYYTFDIQK
jgi:hypothetical protein